MLIYSCLGTPDSGYHHWLYLHISWSCSVCLSLRLVVPLKFLQPLINLFLGLIDNTQKVQIQAVYQLLLLRHFSRVRLCVNPETAAHQAPLSLGFSRQEHWSGLPFPSPSCVHRFIEFCKQPLWVPVTLILVNQQEQPPLLPGGGQVLIGSFYIQPTSSLRLQPASSCSTR